MQMAHLIHQLMTLNTRFREDFMKAKNHPTLKHIWLNWMAYYGKYGRGVINHVLFHFDKKLSGWAERKYKKLKTTAQAIRRVNAFQMQKSQVVCPLVNVRLNDKSRMKREFHVRFRESCALQAHEILWSEMTTVVKPSQQP
jgi:hypothetical protein